MIRTGWHTILPVLAMMAASLAAYAATPESASTSKPAAPAGEAATSRPGGEGPSSADTSASDLTVGERGTMELHFHGADLRRVLQLLSTQSKANIIATPEVQGTVTADLYGVTFTEALEAVLKSGGFRYIRKGNFIHVMTQTQYDQIQTSEKQLSVKVFKLNYLTAADAKVLLANVLSKDGSVSVSPPTDVGVGADKTKTGGNALATEDVIIIRDYYENIERITEILKQLDARPEQVLIEATILRATLTDANALGVDFNLLAGVDFPGLGFTTEDYGQLIPPATPQGKTDTGGANFNTDFRSGLPPGGLNVGFIKNSVAIFIHAIESSNDIVVLANPKLLVMNKQHGEVIVGRRDGYLTSTVSETSTTQTVQFLETGTRLIVRPFVSTDGYVRMEIHPEDSNGSVDKTSNLPSEETTECTSNVLVQDGHTIVISGLFRERTSNGRSQIPVLGNIPIAGALFGSRNEETIREEVIILVTPHIIKHPVDDAVSEQFRDEVDRVRLGARQGLMFYGRDRLAQTYMGWARQNVSAGKSGQALWDINMALNLEPRMQEAQYLKERLTKEALWSTEASCTAVGYLVERMTLQELGEPVEKVMIPWRPADSMTLSPNIREALGIGPRSDLPLWKLGDPNIRPRDPADPPVTVPPPGGK
jgi:type IV pilus assembly protein PilQ